MKPAAAGLESRESSRAAVIAEFQHGSWSVGDHPHDLRAAKAAGIVPIGAAWGSDDAVALQAEQPVAIFKAAEDMCFQIEAGL